MDIGNLYNLSGSKTRRSGLKALVSMFLNEDIQVIANGAQGLPNNVFDRAIAYRALCRKENQP